MIVIDANILLAGLRSSRGASHVLLRAMLDGRVSFALSPAIVLEYEDVLKRPELIGQMGWLSETDMDTLLDALCRQAKLVSPWFRFRPFLEDPKDDIYVECALAASADCIISNDRHFRHPSLEAFGISVASAGTFVSIMRKNDP